MSNLGNIKFEENGEEITIQSDNDMFAKSFYFNQFFDESQFKKFIKSVEKMVRGSKEYKEYFDNLRETVNPLTKDAVLGNITSADATIEFHHYPYTLFDIVEIIILFNSMNKKKFTSFSIAREVMDEHFNNIIGVSPLSTTNHELAHAGELFISTSQIFGDFQKFTKKYEKVIYTDTINKVKDIVRMSEENTPSDIKGLF